MLSHLYKVLCVTKAGDTIIIKIWQEWVRTVPEIKCLTDINLNLSN